MSMGRIGNASGNLKGSQSSGGSGDGGGILTTANEIANNDAVQQAAGDVGDAIAKGGQSLVNDGWNRALNQGATQSNANKIIKTGTAIFAAGKTLAIAGKAAPHVGWVATTAGYASTGQYKGAAIQAVNGLTRTVTVSKIGAAAGTAGAIWATGKLGALAGSWAGPLGTAAGFVIGCGVAYLGGKIWDKTIGAGADVLTQKAADWDAKSQYGGKRQSGWGRDGARGNARNNARPSPPVPRPTSADCR